jgi:hypothetical protein
MIRDVEVFTVCGFSAEQAHTSIGRSNADEPAAGR